MKRRFLPLRANLEKCAPPQCKSILPTALLLQSIAICLVMSAATIAAATFDVTTTADTGAGSLRDAITLANASGGLDTITFHIGSGLQTITPATQLPSITSPVLIDGSTQTAFAGNPLLEINGATL